MISKPCHGRNSALLPVRLLPPCDSQHPQEAWSAPEEGRKCDCVSASLTPPGSVAEAEANWGGPPSASAPWEVTHQGWLDRIMQKRDRDSSSQWRDDLFSMIFNCELSSCRETVPLICTLVDFQFYPKHFYSLIQQMFNFNYFLKLFLWKVVFQKEKDIIHLLIRSPNDRNGRGWSRLKSGACNSIQASHTGGRDPTMCAMFWCFPKHQSTLVGCWIGTGAAKLNSG